MSRPRSSRPSHDSEYPPPPPTSRIQQLLEAAGGVTIAIAAAFCAAVQHLRSSPAAMATLVVCGLVMFPCGCFACIVVTVGLVCCIPVVLIGIACASIPGLHRRARAGARVAASGCGKLADVARDNPVLATGVCLATLPLLPVLLVGLGLASVGFFVFAPITVPAALFVMWRFLPPDTAAAAANRAVPATAHGTPRSTFSAPAFSNPRAAFAAAYAAAAQPPPPNTPAFSVCSNAHQRKAPTAVPPPPPVVAEPPPPQRVSPSSVTTTVNNGETKAIFSLPPHIGASFQVKAPSYEDLRKAPSPAPAPSAAMMSYNSTAYYNKPVSAAQGLGLLPPAPTTRPPQPPAPLPQLERMDSPPLVPLAVPLQPPGMDVTTQVDAAFLAAATRALAACKAAEIRGSLAYSQCQSSAASSA